MPSLFIALLALGSYEKSDQIELNTAAAVENSQSAPTVRLMSAEKEQRLRKMLPRVDDADLQQLLGDPRLILYTDQEIPKAYQIWAGGLQGVHSPSYNISANGSEPFGNGNREFPWGTPAGTHRTKNVEAFRFLWLPRDENDRPLPVVWYRKHLKGDSNDGYAWTFPVGAIVGEVLAMPGPDGYAYTFEMRIRTREYGYWDVNVFRPFPNGQLAGEAHQGVAARLGRSTQSSSRPLQHLEEPVAMKPARLVDRQPAKKHVRSIDGYRHAARLGRQQTCFAVAHRHAVSFHDERSLAPIARRRGKPSRRPVRQALKSCRSTTMRASSRSIAPVARAATIRSAKPVTDFNAGRDWYGHIRGSDGIFSFHPFSPDCISGNGYGAGVTNASRLRKSRRDCEVRRGETPARCLSIARSATELNL